MEQLITYSSNQLRRPAAIGASSMLPDRKSIQPRLGCRLSCGATALASKLWLLLLGSLIGGLVVSSFRQSPDPAAVWLVAHARQRSPIRMQRMGDVARNVSAATTAAVAAQPSGDPQGVTLRHKAANRDHSCRASTAVSLDWMRQLSGERQNWQTGPPTHGEEDSLLHTLCDKAPGDCRLGSRELALQRSQGFGTSH